VTPPLIGRRVIRTGIVGSTMDEVADLAAAGEPEGTVVVAEEQTAGRGRFGRRWTAPRGTALLCSLLLRPNLPAAALPVLSLVAGVALAEAIEEVTGLSPRLKWPNDVWLGPDDRKVAGILAVSRHGAAAGHVVLGIGVNVNVPPAALPPGATSLLVEAGREAPVDNLLSRLLQQVNLGYRAYVGCAGAPPLDGWRRRAALIGTTIQIEQDSGVTVGRFVGVADDGRLLLATLDGGLRSFAAGEINRGPRPAAVATEPGQLPR
jgi:BirA family biotin operon repressor/biotin-[acetyl-CoA-carboxylase] ligase